jgi:hypothetical protein
VPQSAPESYNVLQSVTRCCIVLQRAKKCYKVLQRVSQGATKCCNVLQSAAKCHKVKEGVPQRCYKVSQCATKCQSNPCCHKSQTKIYPKRRQIVKQLLTPGQVLVLKRSIVNEMFVSRPQAQRSMVLLTNGDIVCSILTLVMIFFFAYTLFLPRFACSQGAKILKSLNAQDMTTTLFIVHR